FLDALSRTPAAGETITLTTAEGVPGHLTLLALVAVDGTPILVSLGVASFDANGRRLLVDTVPTGLSGSTMTFRAFALDAGNRLDVSNDQDVGIRMTESVIDVRFRRGWRGGTLPRSADLRGRFCKSCTNVGSDLHTCTAVPDSVHY